MKCLKFGKYQRPFFLTLVIIIRYRPLRRESFLRRNRIVKDKLLLTVKNSCQIHVTGCRQPRHKIIHRGYTKAGDNLQILFITVLQVGKAGSNTKCVQNEGGAKNVARRDGMGTVMLDAAFTMNRLPTHYFQAIGSGTGAIACWEMATRLQTHGWAGNPTLHLSQNAPFVPIYNAWKANRRQILPEDMPNAEFSIKKIHAVVLSNRSPHSFVQC